MSADLFEGQPASVSCHGLLAGESEHGEGKCLCTGISGRPSGKIRHVPSLLARVLRARALRSSNVKMIHTGATHSLSEVVETLRELTRTFGPRHRDAPREGARKSRSPALAVYNLVQVSYSVE
jgi:hypothetical protein